MAAIAHYSDFDGTDNTSADTGFVTYQTIASSNFVAGAKYLIVWRFSMWSSNAGSEKRSRLSWASSGVIAGSARMVETVGTLTDEVQQFSGAQIITAPDPVENLLVEKDNESAGGGDRITDNFRVLVIRMDDDITENTDWYVNVDNDIGAETNLGTGYATFATLTQTFAAGDWLVLGTAVNLGANTGTSTNARLSASGGGLTASTEPEVIQENETSNENNSFFLPRVFTLDGSSATFSIEMKADNTAGPENHAYSEIIAINLDVFEEHYAAFTAAEYTHSASATFEEIQAISPFTPSTSGPWFILGYANGDNGASSNHSAIRVQVGGTSIPDAGVDAELLRSPDNRDESCLLNFSTESLSGSTDIDLDGLVEDNSSNRTQNRTLITFSLELAGGAISQAIGLSTESDSAFGVVARRTIPIGLASEADSALALNPAPYPVPGSASSEAFSTNGTTINPTLSGTPDAGDVIVVCLTTSQGTRIATSVVDQNGDPFTLVEESAIAGGPDMSGAVWIKVADGDETDVTVTYTSTAFIFTSRADIFFVRGSNGVVDDSADDESIVSTSGTYLSTGYVSPTVNGLFVGVFCLESGNQWATDETYEESGVPFIALVDDSTRRNVVLTRPARGSGLLREVISTTDTGGLAYGCGFILQGKSGALSKKGYIGQSEETDSAFSVAVGSGAVAIGQADETDSAFDMASSRAQEIGLTTETDTALAMTAVRLREIGISSETDTALAVTFAKAAAIGLALEADTGFDINAAKQLAIALGIETDSAFTATAIRAAAIGLAAEADTGLSMDHSRVLAMGLSSETDSAFDVSAASAALIGRTEETDSAFDVSGPKVKSIALAVETDTALAVTSAIASQIGLATETDSAFDMTAGRITPIGLAIDTETAFAMAASKLLAMGLASESDVALAMAHTRAASIGFGVETDTGLSMSPAVATSIGLATEADSALQVSFDRVVTIGFASDTETAQSVIPIRLVPAGLAVETDAALAAVAAKLKTIGLASETDIAFALALDTILLGDISFIGGYQTLINLRARYLTIRNFRGSGQ